MFDRLETLAERLEEINRALMDPAVASDATKMRDLGREHAHLSEVVDCWREYQSAEQSLEEARELYSESDDPEMKELAKAEIDELEETLPELKEKLRVLLLPKDPYEGRPILLEIRAGTGGDEAALFAGDLFRMYQRFGEKNGLRFEIMSSSGVTVGGASGGFKEIIASVTGDMAYSLLRFESGVHRVQRVPATESQGRIHTSAATVAVLPEPDEVEVKIDQKDLRIDTMRAGGPGGQSVNTTDSAVRIVHIPTGLIVQCQDEKSQLKNKEKAMRVLKARLLEKQQAEAHAEEAAARKAQVGSGDRSERIRTYNFPQSRLTDHRIGLTIYKLDQTMAGDLQEVTDALMAAHQAALLEEQEA
ncbi:MAG: peptide chain release factor 1 [Deltaproteobacteria bacterium]|nr:MAG: peptide chain release factor 1 [Deltaproteobacteria bacterium]